jgi:hypothetical protein
MEHAQLWLCGQWRGDEEWEFQGIFSSRDLAVAACLNENYFITPCYLDASRPYDQRGLPNCEFPYRKGR